jgi:hypothetical protein
LLHKSNQLEETQNKTKNNLFGKIKNGYDAKLKKKDGFVFIHCFGSSFAKNFMVL